MLVLNFPNHSIHTATFFFLSNRDIKILVYCPSYMLHLTYAHKYLAHILTPSPFRSLSFLCEIAFLKDYEMLSSMLILKVYVHAKYVMHVHWEILYMCIFYMQQVLVFWDVFFIPFHSIFVLKSYSFIMPSLFLTTMLYEPKPCIAKENFICINLSQLPEFF